MKKELKDYLHLYLGCEALVEGYTNSKSPFNYRGIINYQLLLESGQHYSSVKEIRPILRPLSDMTEKEIMEKERLKDCEYESAWSPLMARAESFKYLLSKHFDLFGLIESGLAINAADLQTVKK